VNDKTRECAACGYQAGPRREMFTYYSGFKPDAETLTVCEDCKKEYESAVCVELDSEALVPDAWYELRDWAENERSTVRAQSEPSTVNKVLASMCQARLGAMGATQAQLNEWIEMLKG
jgi:hypothetical protein